jgi:chromosome segregation ATPase
MADVLHLDGHEWLSRAEMAEKLGVSERTVTRKVDRGELMRKNNPNGRGKLYRFPDKESDGTRQDTRHETGQDTRQENGKNPKGKDDARHTRQDTRQDKTRDTSVSRLLERLKTKNAQIAELKSKVGGLSAGLETASDYVKDLEERLASAQDQADQLRNRLQKVRNERAQARAERDQAKAQIDSFQSTIERLKEERENRTTIASIGPLELLWRH